MGIQKLNTGDIEIAYRWDGVTHGPVVMMAHAMGTSHRIWDQQIDPLVEHYRLLRYDWRGHGHTDAPAGPYTLTQFVEDAVKTMDALKLESVHWVGISTGGMIGQGIAINHPERLRSLILCNTTSQSNPWYRGWVAERQKTLREKGMEAVWDMTKHLWFTDNFVDTNGIDYNTVRQIFIRTPKFGYLGGTSAVADLNYKDLLTQIKIPTRIIAASDDPVTPVARSEEIRDNIENAVMFVIEGQRHFSNVEAPEQFNKLLKACLDEVS